MKTIYQFIFLVFFASSCSSAQSVEVNTFEKGIKGDVQILDVRTPEEFQQGHIANAMMANVNDEKEFERRTASLDKEKSIYVYCLAGSRSRNAANQLRAKGFKNVVELAGGMNAWRQANKPVEGNNNVKQMSSKEYAALLSNAQLVLVDFGATWCPPCRKMNPIIDALEKDFSTKLKVVKIDGGAQTELMKLNKIEQMPGFILYKNGKEVWRSSGEMEKDVLSKAIQTLL